MLIVMDRKATMLLSEHENICVGSHTGWVHCVIKEGEGDGEMGRGRG